MKVKSFLKKTCLMALFACSITNAYAQIKPEDFVGNIYKTLEESKKNYKHLIASIATCAIDHNTCDGVFHECKIVCDDTVYNVTTSYYFREFFKDKTEYTLEELIQVMDVFRVDENCVGHTIFFAENANSRQMRNLKYMLAIVKIKPLSELREEFVPSISSALSSIDCRLNSEPADELVESATDYKDDADLPPKKSKELLNRFHKLQNIVNLDSLSDAEIVRPLKAEIARDDIHGFDTIDPDVTYDDVPIGESNDPSDLYDGENYECLEIPTDKKTKKIFKKNTKRMITSAGSFDENWHGHYEGYLGDEFRVKYITPRVYGLQIATSYALPDNSSRKQYNGNPKNRDVENEDRKFDFDFLLDAQEIQNFRSRLIDGSQTYHPLYGAPGRGCGFCDKEDCPY